MIRRTSAVIPLPHERYMKAKIIYYVTSATEKTANFLLIEIHVFEFFKLFIGRVEAHFYETTFLRTQKEVTLIRRVRPH
jgi:hypothetical protein